MISHPLPDEPNICFVPVYDVEGMADHVLTARAATNRSTIICGDAHRQV